MTSQDATRPLVSMAWTSADIEGELKAAVADGRPAFVSTAWTERVIATGERPRIDASLVRQLVLSATAPSGVQIVGATIVGVLNLRNARGPGGGTCNTLKLQDCDLVGNESASSAAVDACHSHLSRLSLMDCRTTGIHLSRAVIDGDLTLDGLSGGAPADGGECWIRARGIRVGGSVTAAGARLRFRKAPPANVSPQELVDAFPAVVAALEAGGAPVSAVSIIAELQREGAPGVEHTTFRTEGQFDAIDLRRARIAGSLSLTPGFRADGALNIEGATIEGDLDLSGAHLSGSGIGKDRDALRAERVHILGSVLLQPARRPYAEPEGPGSRPAHLHVTIPCRVRGTIDFGDAALDGPVLISDVERPESPRSDGEVSLSVLHARFGSSLVVKNLAGVIGLSGAQLAGDLTIEFDDIQRDVVDATRVTVGGELSLGGSYGALVDLSGSAIDGDLAIGNEHWLSLASVAGSQAELRLNGTKVGHSLRVSPITTNVDGTVNWATASVLRVRTAALACYQGWRLGQALLRPGTGSDLAVQSFLYKANGPHAFEIVILDGRSLPIHQHNDTSAALSLETSEQVYDYLSFFCDNVWGEAPFTLVPDSVSVDARRGNARSWRARGQVRYDLDRYLASFRIQDSGEVRMIDDKPIGPATQAQPIRYASGLRWIRVTRADTDEALGQVSPPIKAEKWTVVDDHQRDDIWKSVLMSRETPAVEHKPNGTPTIEPKIDLSGAKVGSLGDEDGRNWGEMKEEAGRWVSTVRLSLDGFEYDRIDERAASRVVRANRLSSRADWVKAQYKSYPPHKHEYSPQPYQQLAQVLRTTGDYGAADDITFEKLRIERLVLPGNALVRWGKKWLFEVPFGYGLRTWWAVATFLIFWLIGAAAVQFLAPLRVDASVVSTVISTSTGVPSQPSGDLVTVVPVQGPGGIQQVPEVRCDRRDSLLYALDVLVPVLDLRQEALCTMTAEDSPSGFLWRSLKAGYAIGGWIVTSGLILTVSGIVRRQVEK